jgi:uncharacterized membrane protein YheB (UPF0754 family)
MSDVLAFLGPAEALADIKLNWWIYASMPFIAAFVGWFTKLVALEMVFRPIEFKGIKIGPIPLGWQGVIPMRAKKMARILCEQLLENLIKPEELFEGLNPDDLFKEIERPIEHAIQQTTKDIALQYFPTLWEAMPSPARNLMIRQIKSEVPGVMKEALDDFRQNVTTYFDLTDMVVTNLEKDKALLVKIIRGSFGPELKKIPVMGFWFGLIIGIVTIPAWAFIHQPLLMPVIGFLNGLVTDYIGMKMLFYPHFPKKYFGFFEWQGLFLRRYKVLVPELAHVFAEEVITVDRIVEAMLQGPMADNMIKMIGNIVDKQADAMPGIAKPMIVGAIGTKRWQDMKKTMTERVIEQVPHTAPHAYAYLKKATAIEDLFVERLGALDYDEVERIFHPILKEDEPLIIFLGAVLGGTIGEIQTLFIETFQKIPPGVHH